MAFNPLQFYEFGKGGVVVPSLNCILNLNATYDEYLTLPTELSYSAEFYLTFKFSFSAESSSYVPICSSTLTRILVSKTNNKILINIGGSTSEYIIEHPYSFLLNTEYKLDVFRNSINEVYFIINNGVAVLIGTKSGLFNINWIGRGATTRRLTGYIKGFILDGSTWSLSEQTGTTATSDDSKIATLNTTRTPSWGGCI